jgi:hypothetical protein
MLPRIIYIVMLVAGLIASGLQHGKVDDKPFNARNTVIAFVIQILLLAWAGFFNIFFK